jgi:hypothetical protein
MVGNDLPEALKIEVEVSVRGYVAEAIDLSPRDISVRIFEFGAELSGWSARTSSRRSTASCTSRCSRNAWRPSRTYSSISRMLSAMCAR